MTKASRDTVCNPDYFVIAPIVYEIKLNSTYKILSHPSR